MTSSGEVCQGLCNLTTSEELLDPGVGAIEIGLLVEGAYERVKARMDEIAAERDIRCPTMIVDLIFSAAKASELGLPGKLYPSIEDYEWEAFVVDIKENCGNNVPKIYVVDGTLYTASI